MALQFWEIEVGSRTAVEQSPPVMEEIQSEVKQGCGDGRAIAHEMLLDEVPAARTDEEHGRVWSQLVMAAIGRTPGNGAPVGINEVSLPVDAIVPGGRIGVFEI